MLVQDVLTGKGSDVACISPTATIAELATFLAEHRIGAAVVSDESEALAGIVSERDVTRALSTHGAALLDMTVAEIMTKNVETCTSADDIRRTAEIMTNGRFRHLPVVDEGALVGIVSIGDIVKKRIDQLETEADQLMQYVSTVH